MNLRQSTFDRLVARHAKAWPLGELPKGPAAAVALPRAVGKPLSPGQDFLSAASMPPRSPPLPRPAPRSSSGAVSSALQRAAGPPGLRIPPMALDLCDLRLVGTSIYSDFGSGGERRS